MTEREQIMRRYTEWSEPQGLKISKGWHSPVRLIGKHRSSYIDDPTSRIALECYQAGISRWQDHSSLWIANRKPVLYLAEPYHISDDHAEYIHALATEMDVHIEIHEPDDKSLWNPDTSWTVAMSVRDFKYAR